MPLTTAPLHRQPKLYLHPTLFSPDPSLGQAMTLISRNRYACDIHPHVLLRSVPHDAATAGWAERLHLHRHPGPVTLGLVGGYAELLLDLGTEVEGWPELELESTESTSVVADFGESLEEAEGLVIGLMPLSTVSMPMSAGRHRLRFDLARYRCEGSGGVMGPAERAADDRRPSWMGGVVQRACRFIRLRMISSAAQITVHEVKVRAEFTGGPPQGQFTCSDPAWQRLWWTSLYTARLCTRPDTFWDGPKRDRSSWHGDARIIQLAWLGGWCDQVPGEGILGRIPEDFWPGAVPGYSADCLAILREQLLVHGDSPAFRAAYERAVRMLHWVAETQCNDEGLVQRRDGINLFFGIGFTDWSEMPQGGRLEELASTQCRQLEMWNLAADLAERLGLSEQAASHRSRACALAETLRRHFWRPGIGMIHTRNHVGQVPNPHLPASVHAERTYTEGIALGESGPSRQANALAIIAGALLPEDLPQALAVLDGAALPPVITPYFQWFIAEARARCGCAAEGVKAFAAYVGGHLEAEGAATIWELYDPRVKDLRRLSSSLEQTWEWQLSLCHGWGSGFVPLVARHLAGIEILEPGYQAIRCAPALGFAVDFQLVVPTPLGPLTIEGDRQGRRLCKAPAGMRVEAAGDVDVQHL